MPRFPVLHVVVAALFVLAGSAEPAWELAHALTHLHGSHGAELPSMSVAQAGEGQVAALGHNHGHDHPVFQVAARPFVVTTVIGPALLSAPLPAVRDSEPVRILPRPVAEANAAPDIAHSPQPRAPPPL